MNKHSEDLNNNQNLDHSAIQNILKNLQNDPDFDLDSLLLSNEDHQRVVCTAPTAGAIYNWPRDENGKIKYIYSSEELNRRWKFLKEIDKKSQAKLKDLEEIFEKYSGRLINPWGSSSGKSSVVRQFISKNYRKGIIYAALTRDEVDQFAYDIASFIGPEKVLILHSNSEIYDKYRNNPSIISEYEVVVMTHYRLLLDPVISLDIPTSILDPFHFQQGRQYIFIDERPNTYLEIPVRIETINLIWMIIANEKIPLQTYYNYLSSEDYDYRIKSSAMQIFKELTGASQIDGMTTSRAIRNLDIILKCLDSYHKERKSNKEADPKKHGFNIDNEGKIYSFYDHLGNIEGNVMIFDGTAPLTLGNSEYWETIPNKFPIKTNGRALMVKTIRMIPRSLEQLFGRTIHGAKKTVFWWLSKIVKLFEFLSNEYAEVLVVCWKNFKDELIPMEIINDNNQKKIVDEYESLLPGNSLPELFERICEHHGYDNIHFTHYQGGKTRGTSQFAKCQAILLLGRFMIPNSAIEIFNSINKINPPITAIDWSADEIAQAILRIQFRLKLPAAIYVSSDWDWAVIQEALDYIQLTDYKKEKQYIASNEFFKKILSESRNRKVDGRLDKMIEFIAGDGKVEKLLNGYEVDYHITDDILAEHGKDGNVKRLQDFVRSMKNVGKDIIRYTKVKPRHYRGQLFKK